MVKRIIYPPVWLVFGLVAVFALNEYYPGPRFTSTAFQLIGGALLVVGLLLLVFAGGLFKKAGTDLVPFRNVTTLVTDGVYRYTRNPMYLGMALVLLGSAVTVGAALALCVPVVFAAKASLPMAVFEPPEVFNEAAPTPKATLLVPVLFCRAAPPKAAL